MKYYDERGYYVTVEELKAVYDELHASGEFEGRFTDYIADCTGKNGTLSICK